MYPYNNMDHFSESLGFGKHKPEAIKLLKTTIDILDEFDIKHMLISGTLLGFMRHNDFIPWDDDIDILVDESIIKKKEQIALKYQNINLFFKTKHDSIKICFGDGQEIPDTTWDENAIQGLLPSKKKYCFPFIDMFIYESGPGTHICGGDGLVHYNGTTGKIFLPFSGACDRCFRFLLEDEMVFFHNYWKKKYFFPVHKVDFHGVKCNIPRDPDHFLRKNYGKNYMRVIESPEFHHKTNTKNQDIIKRDYARK